MLSKQLRKLDANNVAVIRGRGLAFSLRIAAWVLICLKNTCIYV